jgi:hypothetical protein
LGELFRVTVIGRGARGIALLTALPVEKLLTMPALRPDSAAAMIAGEKRDVKQG